MLQLHQERWKEKTNTNLKGQESILNLMFYRLYNKGSKMLFKDPVTDCVDPKSSPFRNLFMLNNGLKY